MTKVYGYHALSTGGQPQTRGLIVASTPALDVQNLIQKATAKGVDGVLLWNMDGFEANGDMPIDGVLRCHSHPDSRVRAWGAQQARQEYLLALDGAGIEWVWYCGFVPIAWNEWTVTAIDDAIQRIFDWLFAYQRISNNRPVRLCIDNSGGKGPSSADWVVREILRRRGFTVGCEPTAHVGTPWVNPDAFSVISGSSWNTRSGWYPSPVPHTEHVLCVDAFDRLDFARMQYQRGAVPCITLDKPWSAADVRRGVAA